MQRYSVPKMSCGHCANVIARAVMSVDPKAEVTIDLSAREIAVRTGTEQSHIAEAIRAAGYENRPVSA